MRQWGLLRSAVDVARRIENDFHSLRTLSVHRELARSKKWQLDRFNELSQTFAAKLEAAEQVPLPKSFVTPLWEKFSSNLREALVPAPPFNFLRLPVIMRSMVLSHRHSWLHREMDFVNTTMGSDAAILLEEDFVGGPTLMKTIPPTSANTLHHSHHVSVFLDRTGAKLNEVGYIVEWGGGYGNMAKMLKRAVADCTYVLIDLPELCALQWIYLSSIFGDDQVLLVQEGQDIEVGRINIVPLGLLDADRLSPDLLISTWALSESTSAAQRYVADRGWFGSRHLLLAFQRASTELPQSEYLGKLAHSQGALIEEIEFSPGNFYATL